ncbi:MAG: PAS domain S-box protein [Actinobacteria bacterium]|nr:PAS domain S-box protein [Actinomycetota bacterium]
MKKDSDMVSELERLRRRVADLEDALAREKEECDGLAIQYEETQRSLREYSSALEERVKELACLYGFSSLVERQDLDPGQIMQGTVELMPPGWHYSEITCARIIYGQDEYRSADFEATSWGLVREIRVRGEMAGSVEVYYRERRPDKDEGPFLREERVLIDAIADGLGRMIEHRGMEEALRESEEKYRLIYDFTGEAIYTYDTELRIIGVNKIACELIGYSEEEILGRNALELGILHPDDIERTMVDIQRLYQGEVVNDELRFIRRDGSVAIGDVTGAPLYDREGKVIAFTNVARDVTESKKAEEALLESEEKFRGIVEQSSDGIVLVDREGVIVEWNRAQERIVGIEREEALGKFLWDVQFGLALEEMRTPQMYESLKRMILDSRGVERAKWFGQAYENEIRRPDGQHHIIESVVFPISTREGNLIGSIIRDITEAKRSEEELKRINRELDAYAYVVSHDLRGPVSIVISASRALQEMLQRPIDEENARQLARAAEIIESSADSSRRLIEDLLSLAQAGQLSEEVTEVDVEEVVRRVLREKAGPIKDMGVRVVLSGDLDRVAADPTHVYQLFSNLIANALAYNDSPEPSVTIGCEKTGEGSNRYWVWDNGSGIAPEDLDKIFNPLFKGKEGGTGIGLSIVKKVVDVYGGEIRVYNDAGARFEFTLGGSST